MKEPKKFYDDKSVDPNHLDLECVRQSELVFKYSKLAAEAQGDMDSAKFQLDMVKSRLEIECRKDPEKFDLGRVSEAGIDAAVKITGKYQTAYETYLNARKDMRVLDAACNALEHKKKMLEKLVQLHGQQYFAGPSVPHDLSADWHERQEQLKEDANQRQKQVTRKRGQRR